MGRSARIAGAAALGLGVALLALAALVIALAWGFQRERVRAYAESALADALGAEVSLGGLDGRLLFGFTLRELRVGPADEPLGNGEHGVALNNAPGNRIGGPGGDGNAGLRPRPGRSRQLARRLDSRADQ